MYRFKKAYTIATTVIITAVLCFMTSSAYYNGKLMIKPGYGNKLGTVIGILDKYYYEDYDKNKAVEGAVGGYVDSLGDPYTVYMNNEDVNDFYNLINSSYCGIGVTVQNDTETNRILVVDVFDGSPAKQAGIEKGDILLKVNGEEYAGEELEEATDNIKGEEGTEVRVTILKKSDGEEKELTIKRQSIEVDSVASEVLEGNIGHIAISQFATNTAAEFTEQLNGLLDKKVKGIVIDVRDNGGGITDAAEKIADLFLKKGDTIYYTSDKNGKKVYSYSKNEPATDLPVIILANGNTASASEILIGALKDNGRAKVVGEKTYGKGVVQQIISMTDDTAVKVTVEKYFTPSGKYIHKKGIEPDYEVSLDENAESDVQLEKAVEILR